VELRIYFKSASPAVSLLIDHSLKLVSVSVRPLVSISAEHSLLQVRKFVRVFSDRGSCLRTDKLIPSLCERLAKLIILDITNISDQRCLVFHTGARRCRLTFD